jgi:hypothetical protein
VPAEGEAPRLPAGFKTKVDKKAGGIEWRPKTKSAPRLMSPFSRVLCRPRDRQAAAKSG